MGKTIVISLNTNSISEMPTPAEHYGRGLAMKLVRQYAEDGCSRLDEGNALAIVCGLLTGTNAPCANRASVAAMGNNAVAVSSISGDFPQKLATLGIDALVLTGKYSDGNAVILVEASSIRIEHMPQLQGKSCNDIVEYIRSTFGNNCAAIGTGRAADMLLPLGALFTTYPEGTPRFTCPRSSFGDVAASKGIRAIAINGKAYFGKHCANKAALQANSKKLAGMILSDKICGGALPGLGSITILHLLKSRNAIPEIPERRSHGKRDNDGRLNYCCAPGCVIGCLNRHTAADGHVFSAPEESEVKAAMAHCFGMMGESERANTALALSKRGMTLGLNTTEFVYTAAMYMELNGETPSSERLMELIGEIERGSITGRLLGSGTVAIGSLYRDNASLQRRITKPANTNDSAHRLDLGKLYPELSEIDDLDMLYRQIFLLENMGICIFSAFALINRKEALETIASLYGNVTGNAVSVVQLLNYAGECLDNELQMVRSNSAACVKQNIPEFVKVLYRYFGE